jgi:nucleoside phosphorylase
MLIIFGALKTELAGIIRSAEARRILKRNSTVIYKGEIAGYPTFIAVTGMGKDRALAAADIVSGLSEVRKSERKKVLITGFCGAAGRGLEAGDTVVYRKVKNITADRGMGAGEYTLQYPVKELKNNNLRTAVCGCTDNVITTPEEKSELSKKYNIDVIDIETYWLVKEIKENGPGSTAVYCIRTVSDGCRIRIPDYFKNGPKLKILAKLLRSVLLSFFSRRELRANICAFRSIKKARQSLGNYLLGFVREFILPDESPDG